MNVQDARLAEWLAHVRLAAVVAGVRASRSEASKHGLSLFLGRRSGRHGLTRRYTRSFEIGSSPA